MVNPEEISRKEDRPEQSNVISTVQIFLLKKERICLPGYSVPLAYIRTSTPKNIYIYDTTWFSHCQHNFINFKNIAITIITLLKSIQGNAVRGGSKPWVSTPNVCKRSRPWVITIETQCMQELQSQRMTWMMLVISEIVMIVIIWNKLALQAMNRNVINVHQFELEEMNKWTSEQEKKQTNEHPARS